MPHFSFRRWEDESFFQGIGPFLIGVLLLVGCQSKENQIEQKATTKAEGKVQITKRRRENDSRCDREICTDDK